MATAKKQEAQVTVTNEPCYDKAQLVASARYARRRDLISSILADGEKYTISQVDSMIAEFYNKDFTERKGE